MTRASPNFAYLAHHDPRLVALATQAEESFSADPVVCLFKLRQFGEILARHAVAKVGLYIGPQETQRELINRLFDEGVIRINQRNLLHDLRKVGNAAVHENRGDHAEALHQLKMARELAIWFQRSFGNNRKFDPGPFVPPPDPVEHEASVADELHRLRKEAAQQAEKLRAAQEEIAKTLAARWSAEERANKEAEDRAIWEALATDEAERRRQDNAKLAAELAAAQALAAAAPAADKLALIDRAASASDDIHLDEAATRKLIDKQLRAAGWEADTKNVTFNGGSRPQKNKNTAIAEWPCKSGPADYILFSGLEAVAVVEAKRKAKDVQGAIQQAKRYSRDYQGHGHDPVPGGPWGDYNIPFLFATNGRPYLRQLQTKSGIQFLDARRTQNHPTALEGWYTPEGLRELLKQDVDAAHAALKVEPTDYLGLRYYQLDAIKAVEAGIENGARALLVAMATGTGKTRTCIGLVYRLLKTRRFRRILFLVDRSALGHQTTAVLKDMRLERTQTFTDIFDIKELGDIQPEPDTRMQVATVQAMVKRVLGPHDDESEEDIPPVDQYDCIVVDECHRGYLLDRELSDLELTFRGEADYISKYRRVLDHFDAVKIGLTATPALHTSEIFGKPIYEYSLRSAVIDDYLVDHEPPTRIVTRLAKDGITWKAGEQLLLFDRKTNKLDKASMPDEQTFDVETFNRRVITENFNRAVLGELVKHIDPEQDEKTLIFCVDDQHCDLVVKLLKEAFEEKYGEVDDDAVMKITGAADKPLELIRKYRNERHPNVAVTVDLLTTGIDVPRIANIVFLRRVRSRILYEQMMGRATRKCEEIGKECFHVFDAVEQYAAIQHATDVKPVVVDPNLTFVQLVGDLLEAKDDEIRAHVLDELLAKLQRKKSRLKGNALQAFETAAGMGPNEVVKLLKSGTPHAAAKWFAVHADVCDLLDRKTGDGQKYLVSNHEDEVIEVAQSYGDGKKPDDYIEAFRKLVENGGNLIPALLVVKQRPRELTRKQLKELKLALDKEGYSEANLRAAFRDATNEDIAASIIGYIRQSALGTPLMPYEERVDRAMKRIHASQPWTTPQRKWLDRIAAQVKKETIVDREALDQDKFKADGGFKRLNKVFDGKLERLLGEIQDEIWRDAG